LKISEQVDIAKGWLGLEKSENNTVDLLMQEYRKRRRNESSCEEVIECLEILIERN